MKIKNYLCLCFIFLALNACEKNKSKPSKFASTTYKNLGPFDSEGRPLNMLKDDISSDLLDFINKTLPNGQNLTLSHPELFTNPEIADIAIKKTSDVFITFVSSESSKFNAIAFYTYPSNDPPDSAKDIRVITYAFPNAGRSTGLVPGDKVKLGTFDPGTSIGFVLMANAWDSTTSKLNNEVVHYCSNDALNPELDPKLRKHAVLVNYAPENKVLIGFEDMDRASPQCDNDFSDVVIYCTLSPL